jgi:Tfp pilus assembly protein PilZ
VPLRVEVLRRDAAPRTEYAVNLSPGGLGLHVPSPLPVGEVVEIRFELPDGGPAMAARGRVVWSDAPPRGGRVRFCEIGLRFEALPAVERARIARFAAGRPEAPPGRS